jgi:hypothetical protein
MRVTVPLILLAACSSGPYHSTPTPDAPGNSTDAPKASSDGAPADAPAQGQVLVTTLPSGGAPAVATINVGTAIGQGAANGATPMTLTDVARDTSNTETIVSATNPFSSTGNVPDPAGGLCSYAAATPTRVSHVTGQKFETTQTDPMVPMAPFYFPLVYQTTNTPTGNAFGGQSPIIGLFDWRPKDIDEAVVVAESDDRGKTWYFMQTVLELAPGDAGCPSTIHATNNNDDGWGHASIIQLPGAGNAKTGQWLYMLNRAPGSVDSAPLNAINLTQASNKFPIWNTNSTAAGANDIKTIATAMTNTTGSTTPVVVQQTVGLMNPDGIMAVFPTSSTAAVGDPVTVMYVQKILNGDTSFPAAQQCTAAPFSHKLNHDVSNVRLATTTDGIHFTDLGIVAGLNDPTTVDYNGTRWVSPRATLIDVHGDGSLWGMYFSAGNCLDGDSDAFHYIGYAESTDKMHWKVYNDINHPIASINTITTANQAGGATVTVPATAPVFPTQPWFAQRLYAPSVVQIDPTHLSMTFAGYGVQSPGADLLNYRTIGNVTLEVNVSLPAGTPNNINAH